MAVETLADAAIVIHPDFSKAQEEVRSGAQKMGETAGKTAGDTFFDKFSGSFKSGGARIAGVVRNLAAVVTVGFGVSGIVKFGLQSAASLQQATLGFQTMLGSAKQAKSFLGQLQQFAAATPFELPGLIDASRTLLGVGVAAKDVIPTLTAYGDAAGALGIQQDAFQRIMIAVSQSLSAGKIKLGDMNQLMNNGLPVWKLMSEAMHKPVPALQEMISHGQLLSKNVLPLLQKQMEKDYGGAMAKQSQTLNGVWSTLKDTVAIGLANALTPLVPLFQDLIPKAANVLVGVFKVASQWIAAFADGLLKGEVKVSGFAGALQSVGAKIGGFISAFTKGGEKVGALGEPYAKLGEEVKNEVIPAHIELAKELLQEVVPTVLKLATTVATTMIPIMYRLEELIKGQIVPAVKTLTDFLASHQAIVKVVALTIGGLVAANKLLEVATKGVELVQVAVNTVVKLGEGVIKGYEVAVKSAAAAVKGYEAALALSRGTIATWIGVKAIEIREFIAGAIAAEGSTAAIIANAIATKALIEVNVLFARGMLLVDAVMDASPFVLVAAAVIALGAAMYLLWTRSATFRNIVEGAWNGIRVAATATASWFMTKVWPQMQAVWDGIAAGATWLWHNIIDPVWHGIEEVVRIVVALVVAYVKLVEAEWKITAAVATWLWHSIIEPVFHGIARVVQAAMAIAQLAMKLVQVFILGPMISAIKLLYNGVILPIFHLIAATIKGDITIAKVVLTALRDYVVGSFTAGWNALRNTIQVVWSAITGAISKAITTVKGWFVQLEHALSGPLTSAGASFANATGLHWGKIKGIISGAWTVIKGIFTAMANFVSRTIPNAFQVAVGGISKFWGKVRDIVKAPISFTVNHIINPLINGFDKVAKTFGTATIPPISGFAEGGRIPGTPSGTDNKWSWLRGPGGQVLGNVGLATGEFVVNARDTAKALPLLQWINDGMAGGAENVRRYLGRPPADMPGDGSEGWAFAKGGLVGFLSDVWAAVANPINLVKKPIEAAVSEIPGSGVVKDLLVGMMKKLTDGLLGLLGGTGSVGSTVGLGLAKAFLKSQNGKPYIWASAGPNGYDCSGIVSAVYNILKNRPVYGHTFSTESAQQFFPKPGFSGPLVAAWSHPGQAPASNSVGHMMGMVGGLTFESTGGRGVHLGPTTRKLTDFANIGHFDRGGIVKLAQIARADFGSAVLERGVNMIYNGTGQREPLVSPQGPARMHPDDIDALARAIGAVVGGALLSTVPLTRTAGRQVGSRR